MNNVSLPKSLYDAFGSGDIPAVLGAEWDGFSVHPKSFHDAGSSVMVKARYSGRFQQYAETSRLQDVMGAR